MADPVLIVGSLALDDIETPIGRQRDVVGGAAYYGALAASLFAPVRLVGVVGDDFPQEALGLLASRGVDLSGVETVEGGASFRWSGRYHTDMNVRDTLDTQLNVFADFNPVLPPQYRDSRYVFLANITPSVQLQVLDQIELEAFVAFDTMNLWIETARDDLLQVMRRANLALMNDAEVRQFAGEANLVKAGEALLRTGPQYAAIKLGEYGAMLVSQRTRFTLPCCPLAHVEDPTGAGDSFAGGLMGYLAWAGCHEEETLRTALAIGTITASRACESFGTTALIDTTTKHILERYELLLAMTRFNPLPENLPIISSQD
jgi:sugar/nucleoside kinase (ribokinase family)